MPMTCAIIAPCSHWTNRGPAPLSQRRSSTSQIDNLAFPRDNRSRALIVGIGGEPVHEIVVMRWIMVKQAKVFDLGFVRQANAPHLCRMTPSHLGLDFVFGER